MIARRTLLSAAPALALARPALAAPLTQRHTYNDLTAWFDDAASPAGHLRVGLAHGCVQGVNIKLLKCGGLRPALKANGSAHVSGGECGGAEA